MQEFDAGILSFEEIAFVRFLKEKNADTVNKCILINAESCRSG